MSLPVTITQSQTQDGDQNAYTELLKELGDAVGCETGQENHHGALLAGGG